LDSFKTIGAIVGILASSLFLFAIAAANIVALMSLIDIRAGI